MEREYGTVPGLTYADLNSALLRLGYIRDDEPERTLYEHPDDEKARLIYARFRPDEALRGIDLFAARAIVDSFGILDKRDFDRLMLQISQGQVALAH